MIPVSLTIPQFSESPGHAVELATRARDLGFAGIFAFDHLVPIGDPHRPVLESFAAIGALAAKSSVRVGSLVVRVTLRPPEVTAAAAATWTSIADGQVVLGLGIGDAQTADEAERFGHRQLGLDHRLEILEETIAAIRTAAPEVPIWVGGRHRRVRELARRLADGLNGWLTPLEEIAGELRRQQGFITSWGGTLLLAPDQDQLDHLVSRRGGSEGAIAATPETIGAQLSPIASQVDEMVLSVVPNRPGNWELLAQSLDAISKD